MSIRTHYEVVQDLSIPTPTLGAVMGLPMLTDPPPADRRSTYNSLP